MSRDDAFNNETTPIGTAVVGLAEPERVFTPASPLCLRYASDHRAMATMQPALPWQPPDTRATSSAHEHRDSHLQGRRPGTQGPNSNPAQASSHDDQTDGQEGPSFPTPGRPPSPSPTGPVKAGLHNLALPRPGKGRNPRRRAATRQEARMTSRPPWRGDHPSMVDNTARSPALRSIPHQREPEEGGGATTTATPPAPLADGHGRAGRPRSTPSSAPTHAGPNHIQPQPATPPPRRPSRCNHEADAIWPRCTAMLLRPPPVLHPRQPPRPVPKTPPRRRGSLAAADAYQG